MKKQTKQLATIGAVIVAILTLIIVLPSFVQSESLSPDGTFSTFFTVSSGQELPFCTYEKGASLCTSGLNADFSILDPSKTRYIVESNPEHGIKYDSENSNVYAIIQTKGVVGTGANPDCTTSIETLCSSEGCSSSSSCIVERIPDSGIYIPNKDVYQIILIAHHIPPFGESGVAYLSFTGRIKVVECYDNEDCSSGVCLDDKTCSDSSSVPEDEIEDSIEEEASNINWIWWIAGGMLIGIIVLLILGIYLWRKK